MRLPAQRWLTITFLATALVFAGVAVYVYAFRFFDWLESDAAVTVLLGAKVLDAHLPVVDTWYYANGDVWLIAPHLLAVLPVAILGLGTASLMITVVVGFVLEIVVLARTYARLCDERWVALFATMVTLMAWSHSHVAFVYIQLAYGFLTVLYLLSFGSIARLAADVPARPWPWVGAAVFVALVAVQNPTRGLVFVLAPVLAGCVWPWRDVTVRRRAAIAGTAVAGWVLAFAVHHGLLARFVEFSVPRGHINFVVTDLAGIGANLGRLARGVVMLCGGGETEAGVRAVPGVLVLVGAVVLVGRDVLASRALTPIRFLAVVIGAQLVAVIVPLLVGNLLVSTTSGRYLIPSLLALLGLAAMVAVRVLAEPGARWKRRLAAAWLVLVPVAALAAAPDARPPVPQTNVWPDAEELDRVAGELARRSLTRGYADVLAANLVTIESGGTALTCPVHFRNVLIPLRWLTDTRCYAPATLPDRFFVVGYRHEHDRSAIRATFPEPLDRFTVGDTYEVSVFRTADVSLAWLDLPLPDGDLARFPMHLTYLHLLRGNAEVDTGKLVATGVDGTMVYGPYLRLPKGDYDVVWIGSGTDTPGELTFAVTADGGRAVLAKTTVPARDLDRGHAKLVRLELSLDRARDGVELLINTAGGARLWLAEVVVSRR